MKWTVDNPELPSYTSKYNDGRNDVKQDITTKIDELLDSGNMSVVSGIMALQMIKTFIKFMDEE